MRLIPRIPLQPAMRIDFIRHCIGRYRLAKARVFRRIRTMESDQSVGETLQHNLKSLKDFSNRRIELLIRPLSVIESARQARSVLLIGPRNENDLLIASAYFNLPLNCFRGLDLISYSKLVDLGDMHNMPYDDNQFDVVICGWTLSYSHEPEVLAEELSRVCKDGGLVAVGVEYSTMKEDDYQQLLGYSLIQPGFDRINSVQQIHALFGEAVGDVLFTHDAPLKQSHTANGFVANPSSVATIFSNKKSTLVENAA